MRTIFAIFLGLLSCQSLAEMHDHHPPHNMIVYGGDDVYASHLVYREPHNFQVILNLDFPDSVQQDYRNERAAYPDDTFIFLLDPADISEIGQAESLSGTLFRRNAAGERFDIASNVILDRTAFRIVFFQELPLSLTRD